MEDKIEELIKKYRKRKLATMEERKYYYCDHGHNWVINLCRDIEKDLKELNSYKKTNGKDVV